MPSPYHPVAYYYPTTPGNPHPGQYTIVCPALAAYAAAHSTTTNPAWQLAVAATPTLRAYTTPPHGTVYTATNPAALARAMHPGEGVDWTLPEVDGTHYTRTAIANWAQAHATTTDTRNATPPDPGARR